MNDDMIPADERLRKQVLVGMVFLTALGAYGAHWLTGAMDEIKTLAMHDPDLAIQEARSLVKRLLIGCTALSTLFSAYFAYLGVRTHRARRFPPPGMRVLRDTRPRTGNKARAAAIALFAVAVLMMISNLFTWGFYELMEGIV